jgi:Tol biopolymer transport system component
MELPENAQLALGTQIPAIGFESPVIALSPDGHDIAYIGRSPSGTMLYLLDIGDRGTKPLAGTEGANYAFFSPDSRWLGLLTNDKVKKISLDGGVAVTLCDARVPLRAVWTRDDHIYFDEDQGSRISRVSAAGGSPTNVRRQGISSFFSQILPAGDQALVTHSPNGISRDYATVVLLSLATGETKVLLQSAYDARYLPSGHLLFGRGGNLFAISFDLNRREVTGDPVLVGTAALSR